MPRWSWPSIGTPDGESNCTVISMSGCIMRPNEMHYALASTSPRRLPCSSWMTTWAGSRWCISTCEAGTHADGERAGRGAGVRAIASRQASEDVCAESRQSRPTTILVYTPHELQQMVDDGNPFIL